MHDRFFSPGLAPYLREGAWSLYRLQKWAERQGRKWPECTELHAAAANLAQLLQKKYRETRILPYVFKGYDCTRNELVAATAPLIEFLKDQGVDPTDILLPRCFPHGSSA